MLKDVSTPIPVVLRRAFPESKILVAIPAFNEGPTIGSVVLKARQFASEVIVIDDGSTDDTAETAVLAGAHVIKHARNLGKGLAVRTAWLYAREQVPEAFVLLDGDHQHNPNDIPRLVETILAGKSDVVIGVRWGKTSGMPIYRRMGKRALDYATAAAAKNGLLTDSQSGYRVFSTQALRSLEPTENGLAIESQLLLEAQQKNLRITEVNIDSRYDLDGSTVAPGRHGSRVLGRIITLVSEKRPLLFFGVSGAILLLIASVIGVIVLETYYASSPHQLAVGYMFIVVFFGIVGIVAIFIGVTLNVLTRISAR
jgi:glycosyltransferase involved in cell wall biosynthesis